MDTAENNNMDYLELAENYYSFTQKNAELKSFLVWEVFLLVIQVYD